MLLSPSALCTTLNSLVTNAIQYSVMIWGKPGVGKSSIVAQIAKSHDLEFIDVRLSQLMPSDLRGVPVPSKNQTHWYPPSFLPTSGKGILFLDEINMAPPAMQGVAQQLILDRKIGDYCVPDGWHVWSAGNRIEDKAAVFQMPAPLANRFLHLSVDVSLDDFKQYAYQNQLNQAIIGFLAFRPELLHKPHDNEPSWPSPRSWEMASTLYDAGLPIAPAVGSTCSVEFDAFVEISQKMPNLDAILNGDSTAKFPTSPSLCYAVITALVSNITTCEQALCAFNWLEKTTKAEWLQLFINDLFPLLRKNGLFAQFAAQLIKHPTARKFISEYNELTSELADVT